jgi:hypothetical protein
MMRFEVSQSHKDLGSGLLDCDTVQSGRWLPMFRRNLLASSPVHKCQTLTSLNMKTECSYELLVTNYQTKRCHSSKPTLSILRAVKASNFKDLVIIL